METMRLTEEQVYQMNYISALNWLVFFQAKRKVEAEQKIK